MLFGPVATGVITKLVYFIISLAAIYLIYPVYPMMAGQPTERPVSEANVPSVPSVL